MARHAKYLPRLGTILAPLAAAVALPAPCHAAAAWMTEAGGADMGMAGAGRAALSLDGASLAANPAAIAGLRGSQVTLALMPVSLDFEFHGDGETPGTASNEADSSMVGSLFLTRETGRFALGLGAYSNAGLGFDYGNEWAGRYVVERAGLKTANLAGAAAYRVTESLDAGISLAAQYAAIDGAVGVNNAAALYGPPVGLPDGRVTLSGSSWAPAGSAGLLYRPTDRVRIGLSWTAPVSHAVPLDARTRGLHPVLATFVPRASEAEMKFDLPQQLTLGATTQLSPSTLIGLEAGRQDWSDFGDSKLKMLGRTIPMFPGGLQDTWNVAAGFRHQIDPAWTVSAGVAYDSSPAGGAAVPAYFPVADQWRYSAGVERRFDTGMAMRVALTVIDQGDARVSQAGVAWPLPGTGTLTGTVRASRVYVLCVASDFAM